MRTMRKHPLLEGLALGVLLGALLSHILDVGAALIVGVWVGVCLHRALWARRKPVQGTAPGPVLDPRGAARAAREDELHRVRVAREELRLRDQAIRLKASRASWLRSRRAQQAREDAAYARGVEETLASWPQQKDWS